LTSLLAARAISEFDLLLVFCPISRAPSPETQRRYRLGELDRFFLVARSADYQAKSALPQADIPNPSLREQAEALHSAQPVAAVFLFSR
jgi:hypothetical protein